MGVDADSRDETRDEDDPGDEEHPTEEEQVEREWHFWLLAILALGGVVLIFFPPDVWPNVGFALVAVAVIGWVLKTATEKAV
jgi:Flp pilus assembly protein TadB